MDDGRWTMDDGRWTIMECVILIGLPGAGKTSFYRAFFSASHRHISKDLWPHARGRDTRQHRELEASFREGQSVVVDNVNAAAADRAPIIALARQHGARIVGYHLAVTTRQAVARNAERSGRAKVANVAIFTAAKKFQAPHVGEGFNQLFRMELTEDRRWKISEVAD
jgi:predicted kinase